MLDQLTITDESGAAAFASATTRAIIFQLMKGERSLSDLRDALAMSLSLLQYHVARLERLGLVIVSSTKPRSGRAIKMYRAAALEFCVPGTVLPRTPGAGLKEELNEALDRAELRQPTNTVYFLDEQGTPRMRRSRHANASAHQRWWRLRLSPADAAKLGREMSDLVTKFERAEGTGGQAHLCHFALVKV